MKNKIRKAIESFGLLPLTESLLRFFSKNNVIEFCKSLKFYLFNHFVTNFPNYSLRIIYLRHVLGIKIGRETFIHMGCFFEGGKTIIGDNSVIGRNCYLGGGTLTIKNNVSITAQTYIFCSTHLKDSSVFECINKNVVIEDYAWIGARAMILPGVRIGRGAILGAMSTAIKNLPDYTVFAGCPAKEVGKRTNNLKYTLRYFPYLQ